MSFSQKSKAIVGALLPIAYATVAHRAQAQTTDSTKRTDVAGAVSITNKGISLLPALTLGKPAAIFDVAIQNGDLSFEPQFRIGLDGKPWSFIFWWRLRPRTSGKLHFAVGAHPAIVFRTITDSANGRARDVIVAQRYLAGELSTSYSLAKSVSVGTYYLYSYGVEQGVARHTHFAASRANLTNVRIAGRYFVQLAPQVYYLRMADREGVFLNSSLTLARLDLPVSVSTMVNRAVQSRIAADNFLWNMSLSHSFK